MTKEEKFRTEFRLTTKLMAWESEYFHCEQRRLWKWKRFRALFSSSAASPNVTNFSHSSLDSKRFYMALAITINKVISDMGKYSIGNGKCFNGKFSLSSFGSECENCAVNFSEREWFMSSWKLSVGVRPHSSCLSFNTQNAISNSTRALTPTKVTFLDH